MCLITGVYFKRKKLKISLIDRENVHKVGKHQETVYRWKHQSKFIVNVLCIISSRLMS
jgi:hypothetical protein